MKAKIIINKKKYEVEVTEEQVIEIEKLSKKRWRAEKNKCYYYMTSGGDTVCEKDILYKYDDFRYSIGNYFKTNQEAREHINKLIYQQKYKDYVNEHNECEIDWNNHYQLKYYAFYSFEDKSINITNLLYFKDQGAIYSTSKGAIENFIKEIGEDNFKKYILEIEG